MTSETRYFYYAEQTVNGLETYALLTGVDSSGDDYTSLGEVSPCYYGIRVWRRDVNGNEYEITSGTPVAQVNAIQTGLVSATWSCPQTALNPTDCIVVRLYMQVQGTWELLSPTVNRGIPAVFITDQAQNWNNGAGANQLNTATWTVEYYLTESYNSKQENYTVDLYWGTTNYKTQIQNFSYSAPGAAPSVVVPVLDGLSFIG